MAMFTICTAIIPEGELEKQVSGFRESEKRFTREIGVLQRDFYQCIQQPRAPKMRIGDTNCDHSV